MTDGAAGRVALVRFTMSGTKFVGSGLLVNDQAILTADHVADGFDHQVDIKDCTHEITHALRSGSPQVDLAVLTLKNPVAGVGPLRYAQVDRDCVSQIYNCSAVGFPRWKLDGGKRRSAQVDGTVPTAEGLEQTADGGLRDGLLTLVGNREPAGPPIDPGPVTEAGTSLPWGGMSGAVVTADGAVIGVVRSVNLAADNRSLTVTPLTAINALPDQALKRRFWDALGVSDPAQLVRLPLAEDRERSAGLANLGSKIGIGGLTTVALLAELYGQHHPIDTYSAPTASVEGTSHESLDSQVEEHLAPDDVRSEDGPWIDDASWGDFGFDDSGAF